MQPKHRVYIARSFAVKDRFRHWVVFDEDNGIVVSLPNETRKETIQRYCSIFDLQLNEIRLVQYRGIMRPSELACTMADVRHPVTKENSP